MRLHRDRAVENGGPHEIRDLVCSLKNVTTGTLQLFVFHELRAVIVFCFRGADCPELRLQFEIAEFLRVRRAEP